jgi:membrane associated rhomboid family serine protease
MKCGKKLFMSIPTFPKPSKTPHPLKTVLWVLFLSSIGGYILQSFNILLPRQLGLSIEGLAHWHLWSLITYPFTYPYTHLGDLIFYLGFNLVFLWVFGLPLLERLGTKRFLFLFFGSTLFAGIAASIGLYLLESPKLFAGPTPPLFALITAWTILHGMRNVHISHIIFRPLWIFGFLVGINLVLDAISGLWIQFIADSSAALFAYLFCLISERVRSSINSFYPFERAVLKSLEQLQGNTPLKKKTGQIFDFKTGQPILDDEQFMDAMLAKISVQGEEKLTADEKARMQKISERKTNGKR